MIPAKDIAKRFRLTTPIDRIVRETLRDISGAINRQTREGKTIVDYNLKLLYEPVGDLSERDIRVLVCAGVIQELETNGYKVEVNTNDGLTLVIKTGIEIAHELDVNTAREFVRRHNLQASKKPKTPIQQLTQPQEFKNFGKTDTTFSMDYDDKEVFDILNDLNN